MTAAAEIGVAAMADDAQAPDAPLLLPEDSAPQDWAALERHLGAAGISLDLSVAPRQFTGGYGNLNFLIRLDRGWAVLRRPPPGDLPPGANDMRREHRVLSVLAPVWSLAPRAYHVCDDTDVLGVPFLISEYREGRPLHGREPLGKPMTPDMAARLSVLQVEILASLHALDVDAIGAGGLGRREGFAVRTRAGWRKRLMAGVEAPPEIALTLFDWLDTQTPRDDRLSVMHNDFKLDNVLVDPDDPTTARAVLDWDMATLGAPLFDLATVLTYWIAPTDPEPLREINLTHSEVPGALSRAELVTRYLARMGADAEREQDEMRFFLALAFAKLGVVLMQLHDRYRRDPDGGARYAKFGGAIASAFDMGHEAAAGRLL